MKLKSMFTITKTRGTIFSHFAIQSEDGLEEIRIITGGDPRQSLAVSVQCFVRGVKHAAIFSSNQGESFSDAVEEIATLVRCLAVGSLRQRGFLLATVLEFGPNLPIEPAPVGRGSRRAAAPISADQRRLAVNSPSDLCPSAPSADPAPCLCASVVKPSTH